LFLFDTSTWLFALRYHAISKGIFEIKIGMKNKLYILLLPFFLMACSSTQKMNKRGVQRVKTYVFSHQDIPLAFDGFRMAFASDFHYKSILTERGLKQLVAQIENLKADVLLLGGDYVEGCENRAEFFARLSQINPPFGIYAVMGNNDYEICYADIVSEMKKMNIKLLEHDMDTLKINDAQIILSGVRNPFDLKENGIAPSTLLHPEDFVILISHTPDYAEKGNIENVDFFLAGHTHGGQVTLFGIYAPQTASVFGQKFRTGLTQNSHSQKMLITNGIGTSRKKIRLFAPSEVVLVVLKSE
jgi:predicted MPP superfamily phosphohydrolase